MTREEAIKVLEMFLYKQCDLARTRFAYDANTVWDAVNMASEVLEQQPCEDCISREEVLDEVNRIGVTAFDSYNDYSEFYDFIDTLPSVTPQRPQGKWIEDVDRWGDIITTVNGYKCSECNTFNTDKDNYCPYCGAKMNGGDNIVDE